MPPPGQAALSAEMCVDERRTVYATIFRPESINMNIMDHTLSIAAPSFRTEMIFDLISPSFSLQKVIFMTDEEDILDLT